MNRYLLAVLSGILVMFSFPTVLFGWHVPNLGFIGWVALVPLFVAIARETPRRTFLLAFVAGCIWFGGTLYWIFRAVHVYGGVGAAMSVMITVLLVVLMAAYTAAAPALARWIGGHWRGEMIVFMPVVWVAMEFARAHVPFGGFPWATIAMSQWAYLVPIQVADLVGIYGLIFGMVWVNWFAAEAVQHVAGTPAGRMLPKIVMTVLLIAGIAGYGVYRLHALPGALTKGDPVNVGVAQGNIPQEQKWSSSHQIRNLNVYRAMTRQLYESSADLIIWPEAAFTREVGDGVRSADPRVLGLPGESIGDLPAVMIGVCIEGAGDTAYNSSLLFDAQGRLLGRYDKTHLVPFGEYIPVRKWLFFARKLVAPVGDFMPGRSLDPLVFPGGALGTLICYEDVFPEISRIQVQRGATILANITNDAWYGVSSAPYQHLALSVFRAVENRRYLIRSTNTGVSAIIDPRGAVIAQSPLFERSILAASIVPVSSRSFYTDNGDWFAGACAVYTVVGVIISCIMGLYARLRRRSA